MRISFIIPYHNEPAGILRECVSSILSLSLNDSEREIIVIDDGSDASPKELLKKLHTDIIYIHQENQGLSAARNSGLNIATGDYIQFVDSDDALIPNIYERVIQNVRGKQMDMLMFRFTDVDDDVNCRIKGKRKTKQLSKCYEGYNFLLHENLRAAACCYIFRKEILGNLCFYTGIYHEDTLFTPQLIMRADSLYVLKEKAYFYRQGEGTIMSNRDEKHIQKRLNDTVFILLELQKLSDNMEGEHRKAMQRCINQQTMCYLYTIITLKRSLNELRQHIATLADNHLYPLPLKRYTWKYWIFAFFTKFMA